MNLGNWFNHAYWQIGARLGTFLLVFFVIVLFSYAFLYAIDFIPEPVGSDQDSEENSGISDSNDFAGWFNSQAESSEETMVVNDAFPMSITFDSLDRTVDVLNPASRTIEDLDQALLSGAVRHPDSADFQNPGNIFILGHSSYLPNVLNRNFQAFNGIQELTWGDTVRLRSTEAEYVYRVDRVYQARASEVEVPINTGEAKLTLATCNTFGSREDRFIVEATLIDTKSL